MKNRIDNAFDKYFGMKIEEVKTNGKRLYNRILLN